jgi:succinate dehydrogenase/fumarate reductase cytochrome b subunit
MFFATALEEILEVIERLSSKQSVATLKNLKYKIYLDFCFTFLVTTYVLFHSFDGFTIILPC